MPLLLLTLLWLVLVPASLGAQRSACADPTPLDTAWWHYTRTPNPDGSVGYSAPQAPAQPSGFRPNALVGTYRMQLVHTVGPDRGQAIEGSATLAPASDPPYDAQVAVGVAKMGTPWPSYLSFAPDPSFAPTRQPIEVDWLPAERRLSLSIGNANSRWTDSGVYLEVFAVTDSTITGRWVDGGLLVFGGRDGPHPQGWFCLSRAVD